MEIYNNKVSTDFDKEFLPYQSDKAGKGFVIYNFSDIYPPGECTSVDILKKKFMVRNS